MNKNRNSLRIQLRRHTVKTLSASSLGDVHGGLPPVQDLSFPLNHCPKSQCDDARQACGSVKDCC